MPDYFESANKDFRYQLTVIGSFAQAIIKEELSNGQFVIATLEPNIKVSWEISGVRADKWAEENRVIVETDKKEPGTYLHPELYGQDKSKSVFKKLKPPKSENKTQETTRKSNVSLKN